MNKKTLSFALLAALSLSVASCKSKTSDAPVNPVNPVGPVNPVTPVNPLTPGTAPTGPIQVDTNADATSNAAVVLKSVAGATVKIGSTTYTVGANGFIGLDEIPSRLAIESNDLTELLINKKTLPWVTNFTFTSPTVGASKDLKVDLSGLTGVRTLSLSGYDIAELDLTPLKELTTLSLGRSDKNSNIKQVKLSDDNKIRVLSTRSPFGNDDLDLSKLPALESAILISPRFTSIAFPNSPRLHTLGISRPTAGQAFDLTLTANPQLSDLTLQDVSIPNFTAQGIASASVFNDVKGALSITHLTLRDMNATAVRMLLGKITAKTALQSATLPGYGLVVGRAPLEGFTNLTTTNL